ncbi:hypothetical protein N7G274_005424 [Stereocaulon virgatum]|uniref:Uncharacterized protein n=1 Tax=Stereocaulon virgatum TaxID=373712 RepID=A0ABR4A946_9LECA
MHASQTLVEHDVFSSGKDIALRAVQVGCDAARSFQHTLSWENIPSWMQSDPYIRRGYRRQLNSFSACLRSIFHLHNESVNIWSHLLPTLFYLSVLLATDYSILHNGIDISTADNAVIQTYVFGSITCLIFSAWFHIVAAHSEQVAMRFLKLDYLGILLNVAACATTFIYAGLYGKPNLQAFYISLFVICTTTVLSLIVSPLADGPEAAVWRTSLFIGLAASGFAPVAHMAIIEGTAGLQNFPIQKWCIMALFYLAGAAFYNLRVPEKFSPGTFDIWVSEPRRNHLNPSERNRSLQADKNVVCGI